MSYQYTNLLAGIALQHNVSILAIKLQSICRIVILKVKYAKSWIAKKQSIKQRSLRPGAQSFAQLVSM